jgi:hypothetical protein
LAPKFIYWLYEQLQRIPERALSWEAEIEGSIKYQSDRILNLQIKHYTYTGGAHGYQGLRSLFLILPAGKSIPNNQLFKDRMF